MLKKTLLNFCLLLLCMIVGGVNSAWADKITDYNNIVSGNKYYIGATTAGTDYYLSVKGSSTSESIAGTAVTSKSEATVFIFNGSGTSWTIGFESGYYLSLKNGKDNGKVQVVNSASTFIASNQSTKLRLTIGSYSIQKNNSGTQFGSYGNTQTDIWLEQATVDLSDDDFKWSASSYSATIGASNSFPTLTNTNGVNVSYASTNPDAAMIDPEGNITLIADGKTTIKAVFAGNSTYNAKTVSYDLTVFAAGSVAAPTFSVADGSSIELGSTVTITAPEGCTLKYQIGDGEKTSVDANTKELPLDNIGDVTLKAWSVKDAKESDEATINLTVTKHPITLSFSPDAVSVVRGENVAAPTLNGNTGSGTVTYASSDDTVATVSSSTGEVTGVKAGSTTITATVAETAEYLGGSATFDVTVTKPYHTVTFSVNGNTSRTASVEEDAAITFPTAVATPGDDETKIPEEINGMTFVGWYGSTYTHASTAPDFVSTSTTTMGENDVTYYAVYADRTPGTQTTVTDELTRETTGVSNGGGYSSWSDKSVSSDAVYAGCNAGGNNSIQLNASTSSSKRGIVSTTTGGKIKSVSVEWNSNSNTSRSLTVYGSNSAYESVSAFNSSMGTSLGSITKGTSTSLNVTGNYTYIGLYATGAIYLDKISITWETGTPDTYSNYCTAVSALPRPVITMADVEMTWGDTDKSVEPKATVGEDAYEGTFTFTSSDDENLTVATDGKLTCNVPGTYTVTASIAATPEHQAASVDCTVTVDKKDASLTFVNATVQKMLTDESYTQTATKTPAEAGDVTYTISPSGNEIDANTGEGTLSATGNYTVTATAAENALYNEATASYTLQVRKNPTITVSDKTLAYGETYEPTVEGGAVTITATPNLITVDEGVITAAVVGTATVTVTTEADDDTYVAGEETFTLTVTAPEALSAKPSAEPVTVFYESFDKSTGSIDATWSGSSSGSGVLTADQTGWDFTKGNGAGGSAKLGTSGVAGSAKTPQFDVVAEVTYTLTFKAAPWGDDSSTMTVTMTGGTINGNASVTSETMAQKEWNSFEYAILATSIEMTIEFNSSNNRFFLDEVKITKPGVDIASVPVTVSTSGYATYCCQYPLDLSTLDSKVKAYTVTAVTAETVTFTKITGTIMGGVPFILYGETGDYDLTVAAESTTVPTGNMLVGTLAPTFVEQVAGDYTNFGLSATNGDFRKIKTGGMVVPANKAYLPVLTTDIPAASRLAIIFDDDETTTIQGVTTRKDAAGTYYNIKGQRVEQPVKGGLYIQNGRKVIKK